MENNGKGIFYGVIGVATLIVAIIGATFAFFAAGASNNTVAGNTATVGLNLAVTKVSDDKAAGLIPQPYAGLDSAVVGTTGQSCVDGNGNSVCQVYKIEVSTTSASTIVVDGTFTLTAAGLTNLKWAELTGVTSDELTDATAGTANATSTTTLQSDYSLTSSTPLTKYVVVWLEETTTDQSAEMAKGFTGVVSFTSGDGSTGVTSTFTS